MSVGIGFIGARRTFWWIAYSFVAAPLPNRSRLAKRLRALSARGYCQSVHPTANINRRARLSSDVKIGSHGGVGEFCILSGDVTIGSHVTMGRSCMFITGDHPVPPDMGKFRDMKPTHAPIVVEEDVFIGSRAIILPGVRVGRGAAVGAGAVVAKDVAPGAVVVGNPAREVRRRTV